MVRQARRGATTSDTSAARSAAVQRHYLSSNCGTTAVRARFFGYVFQEGGMSISHSKMKKTIAAGVAALTLGGAAIASATPAEAQWGGGWRHHGGWRHGGFHHAGWRHGGF